VTIKDYHRYTAS